VRKVVCSWRYCVNVNKRLGVMGTMVWDTIYARDVRRNPFQEWGGLAYALAGADAAVPQGWTIVPIIKVGADLAHEVNRFLQTLQHADITTGIRVVDQPNNRVELRYQDAARRTEQLSGGVPPWRWEELEPIVRDLDALYINLISGFELELPDAIKLRLGYHGPMYVDLHSLLLGVEPTGIRVPRALTEWREWLRCFDVIQLNDSELATLAGNWGDPWSFAAEVVGDELKVLLVTLGDRGAAYVAAASFDPNPFHWRPRGIFVPPVSKRAAAISAKVPLDCELSEGDPTGCGDVWGATCFCRLLAGDSLEEAMMEANRAASRNVRHRGATGLNHFLRGRLSS
jgi:sugar/nucleoside kinase (ribokinase family)